MAAIMGRVSAIVLAVTVATAGCAVHIHRPSATQPAPTSVNAPPATSAPAPVPQLSAAQQLRQIANADRAAVTAQLVDRWIPQLSAKRPGIVDHGVTYDDAMTLQEHQQLRSKYPNVKLLWSGDWSTFSERNFWVTVVGMTFPDSAGALAWCRSQRFERDQCHAKIVSTTHPVEGSTAYN